MKNKFFKLWFCALFVEMRDVLFNFAKNRAISTKGWLSKSKLVLLVLSVILTFTGCSYSQTGIESLLQPPRLSKQQNDIYSALELALGKNRNIKLKYPRKGDFKSAFLITNIDEESTQEAIVFFETSDSTSSVKSLRIAVLDQVEGKWVLQCDIGAGSAENKDSSGNTETIEVSEIEKVSFINSNGRVYIAFGFNLLSNTDKLVKLYRYENEWLNEVAAVRCSDFEVFDINGDKQSEIVTITKKRSEKEVQSVVANVYKITATGMQSIAETEMDPTVSEYPYIHKGNLTDGTPALYLDGVKGTSSLSTEILAMIDSKLYNMIYSSDEKFSLINETVRNYGAWSADLNYDGVYEIPNVRPALGYENVEKHQRINYTNWFNYKDGEMIHLKTSYVDYTLGYVVTLSQNWIDQVTVEYISNDNQITFYEYNNEDPTQNKKLASIKVLRKQNYDKSKHENYQLLKDNGQLMYLYRIHPSDSPLAVDVDEFATYFALLP